MLPLSLFFVVEHGC